MKRRGLLIGFLILFASINHLAVLIASSAADDIPRITIQEMKAKMDRGDDIIVIDVRTGDDFERSKNKIKGAVRISIVQLANRSGELSKDKEIITYCT